MSKYGLEVKIVKEEFPTHGFQDNTRFPRKAFVCADMSHCMSTGVIRGRFLACLCVPGSSFLPLLKKNVIFSFLQSAEIFNSLIVVDFLKMTEKGLSIKLAGSFYTAGFFPCHGAEFAWEFLN